MVHNGLDAVELMKATMSGDYNDCDSMGKDRCRCYDAVLMDNHMPMMDGLTATTLIRDLGYNGVIVGLTGDTNPDDVNKFLAAGANFVLAKPFDINLYYQRLGEFLN